MNCLLGRLTGYDWNLFWISGVYSLYCPPVYNLPLCMRSVVSHHPAHHSAARSIWPWPERVGSVRLECWLRPEGGMEVGEENVSPLPVNNHWSRDCIWAPSGVCWPHPGYCNHCQHVTQSQYGGINTFLLITGYLISLYTGFLQSTVPRTAELSQSLV